VAQSHKVLVRPGARLRMSVGAGPTDLVALSHEVVVRPGARLRLCVARGRST